MGIGFSIQSTMPRGINVAGHWSARADGTVYDSYGRKKYGGMSGDAEQGLGETCCGQMSLAWLCVYRDCGAVAARMI